MTEQFRVAIESSSPPIENEEEQPAYDQLQPRGDSCRSASIRGVYHEHEAVRQRHARAGDGEVQKPPEAFWQFLRALRVVGLDGFSPRSSLFEILDAPQFDAALPVERESQRLHHV